MRTLLHSVPGNDRAKLGHRWNWNDQCTFFFFNFYLIKRQFVMKITSDEDHKDYFPVINRPSDKFLSLLH